VTFPGAAGNSLLAYYLARAAERNRQVCVQRKAQVTINGYPLYLYAGDTAPGQAVGNGIEGAWHVIKV
jgi:predicted lipoprotein with Yx(FWY)xxD motif